MNIIYVYVLNNCPICEAFKEKVSKLNLQIKFKFIDETKFVLKRLPFKHLSFPQFFYIKNNKKYLLDRTAIINKFLAKEILNK